MTPSTPVALTIENLEEIERLQRLSRLELAKPGALTPGGFQARSEYTAALIENEAALLATAREHARLVSALDFLERNSGRQRGFWLPENIIESCVSQGWKPEGEADHG